MVLCDAGSFDHAKMFVKKALGFEEEDGRKLEMKLLLAYSKHNSLKMSLWMGLSVLAEWAHWETKKLNSGVRL